MKMILNESLVRCTVWVGTCCLLLLAGAFAPAQARVSVGAADDWSSHGGGSDESSYSRLRQINSTNIGRLGLAWSLDLPGEAGAKPLIWSEWGKFLAAQKVMVDEAVKLELAVKSGNRAAVWDQLMRAAETGCAGCHRIYRERVGLPF